MRRWMELLESFRLDSLSAQIDPDRFVSWEGSLLQLIDWTRTPIGQEQLAYRKAVPVFLSLLKRVYTSCRPDQSSLDPVQLPAATIQLVLKLLRNLCVLDSNKDDFLAEKGPLILVPVATGLLSVRKANHEDSSKVEISGESNTSKHDAATCLSKDAYDCSQMRADLESNDRSLCGDFNSPSSGRALDDAGCIHVSGAIECLRMLLQLLGNFSRGGDACQMAVWQEFFPTLFSDFASLRSKPVSDVLCMILCTCCRGSKERSWQLCQGQGVGLMGILLVSAVTNDEIRDEKQIDWFDALWRHLCLDEDLFPLLFTNLGIIHVRQVLDFSKVQAEEYFCACQIWLQTCTFTFVQVHLLSFFVDSLSDDLVTTSYLGYDENAGEKLFISKETLCFMVKILKRAAECAQEESDTDSAASLPSWPSAASPCNQILGCLLLLWRVLGTCDPKIKQRDLVTQVLLQHGLLDLLLKMLEVLGPPEAAERKPKVQNNTRERSFSGSEDVPSIDCYQGYRRDIVAVIANVSHQNRLVQDHIRETGKLLVVLQQCTVDEHNPFLREWGLWAMRNLLEGNDLNQKEVASLEMKEAVNLPELTNMGLRFELDPSTGGPRLVNIGSQN